MTEQTPVAEPRHKMRAKALTDEFVSVSLPAIAKITDHRAAVFVTTGGHPARVRITLDEHHYIWQIADRHHSHKLSLDMPVAEVCELVAICFAKRCADVQVLAAPLG